MTAQILTSTGTPMRSTAAKFAVAEAMPEAHALGLNASGQLWERVAESKPDKAMRGRRRMHRARTTRDTGPLVWNSGCLTNDGYGPQTRDASGIIRAGERVK